MHTRWIRRLAATTGLAVIAGLTAVAAESAVPKSTTDAIVADNIAALKKVLAKEPQRKEWPAVKATAVMIAAHAQDHVSGPDAAKMAGLRDQAIKVAEAAAAKDYAKAKDAAAGLDNPPAGAAGAPVDLSKAAEIDISEVMIPYRSARSGGMEMERDLKKLMRDVSDVEAAGKIGGRSVVLGELTKKLPTDKASASPDKLKKWEAYSDDMVAHAKAVADEAAKPSPDMEMLKKKLTALDASCTNCHNDYQD